MKCCYCGQGMDEGKNMLPIEPKGTPNRKWACTDCIGTDDVPEDIKDLCKTIDPDYEVPRGKLYKRYCKDCPRRKPAQSVMYSKYKYFCEGKNFPFSDEDHYCYCRRPLLKSRRGIILK